MRRHLPLVAAACLAALPAQAIDMPARKPGLWEMKMNFEGRNTPPQVMQQCIDAETDKMMGAMGGNTRNDACSKHDVQQAGNTITVDSVCKIGPMTTASHGVITGDFDRAYTVKVTSKREGGPAIPGLDATTSMTIEAKWTGPCKADQKPGDMIMSNGMKMNIRDIPNLPGIPGR
jgi:Protein of unknown function (DUF3617)